MRNTPALVNFYNELKASDARSMMFYDVRAKEFKFFHQADAIIERDYYDVFDSKSNSVIFKSYFDFKRHIIDCLDITQINIQYIIDLEFPDYPDSDFTRADLIAALEVLKKEQIA